MYIHAWMTKRGVGTYDKIAYKVYDNCSCSGEHNFMEFVYSEDLQWDLIFLCIYI